jgi:hypothetical protein
MISECLDCVVGNTHVAVPLARVDRLVEYEISPAPPLSHPWLGGIGLLGTHLFLSIQIGPVPAARDRRAAKGLLLRPEDGGAPWALEVDQILGIEEVLIDTAHAPAVHNDAPDGWLLEAERPEGGRVAWLDVEAIDAVLNRGAAA